MKCIYCNCTESRVVDSRPTEDGAIRRRRECEECKRRFTTYEKIEMLPVLVVKKDKRREQFDAAEGAQRHSSRHAKSGRYRWKRLKSWCGGWRSTSASSRKKR